jgi:hypothetical protein
VQFVSSKGATTSVPITRRTAIAATGAFKFSLGSSVARETGPLQSRELDVPPGLHDLRVTFSTPDASADDIIDYFLIEPNGIDGFYDRTPSTTPQGIGSSGPNGNAAIVVSDPPAGKWIVQAMIDLTTSGKEFTQTVIGNVSYDSANVHFVNVPDSASKKLAGSAVAALVVNTTGIGRTFSLQSLSATGPGDISGPDVYIRAGGVALLTATITPAGPSGTVETGELYAVSNGSDLSPLLTSEGFFVDSQTLAEEPYTYTVR